MFKLTGKPPQMVDIAGYFLPWYTDTDEPVTLHEPGDSLVVLPIFSTARKLREAMSWARPHGIWAVRQIDDGPGFLRSLGGRVQVVIDPHNVGGKTRGEFVFLPSQFG